MRPYCIHTKLPKSRNGASTFVIDLDAVVAMSIGVHAVDMDEEYISLDVAWGPGGLEIEMSSKEEAEAVLAGMLGAWTNGQPIIGRTPDFLSRS